MDLHRVERRGEGGGVEGVWRGCGGVWRVCGGSVEGGRHRCSTVLKPPFHACITDVPQVRMYM